MALDVEHLFDEYLARCEDDGADDFEQFVAEHRAAEADLRRLYDEWKALETRLGSVLPPPIDAEGVGAGLPRRRVWKPGDVLGDYRLERLIGQGGMGQVWEAEQLSLRRRVALKLVRPDKARLVRDASRQLSALTAPGDGRAEDGLAREARAGGRLDHPGLVAVYAAGEIDGVPYIAQQLVGDGRTLADELDELRAAAEGGARIDYRRLARLFAEVAEAVHVAHEAGTLHRDLKPHNILLGADDRPRVTDFGLAWTDGDGGGTARPGLLGTCGYMSPEQAGDRDVAIDRRSDVFSLGAVLYEALTLRRAFEGDEVRQILRRVRETDPPDPRAVRSRVPADLALVCNKALEKNRADRYQSMAELAADLRAFLAHEPIAARPPGPVARALKWSLRHPGWSTGLALAAAAMVVVSLFLVREVELRRDAEDQRDRADAFSRQVLAQGYRGNLLAAVLDLQRGEHAEARRLLAACAPELRDWVWSHLSLRADTSTRRLGGRGPALTAVACADGGALLATGAADGAVVLWDGATGAQRGVLAAHGGAVRALAVARDGRRVASGGDDGRVCLWDASSGALLATHEHAAPVRAVALSADGARLASGGDDDVARLWDADLTFRPPYAMDVVAVALADDGARLAVGGADGTVDVWDTVRGELLFTRAGLGTGDVAVALADGGRRLAFGTNDGLLALWDVETAREIASWRGHGGAVSAVAMSADGARLASVSADENTARLWDARGAEQATLTGHGRLSSIALGRDGLAVLAGCVDGEALLWDGRTRDAVVALAVPGRAATALAVSGDGGRVLTASGAREALLWDGRVGRLVATLEGHQREVSSVALSADGAVAVTGSYDRTVRVWDARDGAPRFVLPGHRVGVTSVAVDAAGDRVASGSYDHMLRIWDLPPRAPDAPDAQPSPGAAVPDVAPSHVVPSPSGRITSLALTADGRRAAGGCSDGTVFLWDENGGDWRLRIVRESSGLQAGWLALSRDGRRLAWAPEHDDTITVWDGETLALVAVLRGSRSGVAAMAMSSDGQRLLSASSGSDVLRLWDVADEEKLAVLAGHTRPITAVAMSADGQLVVSTARDGTLRLWESDRRALHALWRALDERGR